VIALQHADRVECALGPLARVGAQVVGQAKHRAAAWITGASAEKLADGAGFPGEDGRRDRAWINPDRRHGVAQVLFKAWLSGQRGAAPVPFLEHPTDHAGHVGPPACS